jgi:uncharacterized protein YndB with AHSA1/START domain
MAVAVNPTERELIITRDIKAPIALVWAAFTEVEHRTKWWGPRGFRTTTHSRDFRVGGDWRFTMHGPDGTDYPNWVRYTAIEPERRLAYTHGTAPDAPVMFHAENGFETVGDRTRVSLRMVAVDDQTFSWMRDRGAIEGGTDTLTRLEEHLALRDPFVITRVVKAPRARVFEVFSQAEHLVQWFGPKGMPMEHCDNDPRPGGRFHYSLRMPDGELMWGKWQYRELRAPERLVYLSCFSDADGGLGRHPLAPEWPQQMITVVTFEESGPDRTLITITWAPFEASATEAAVFDAGRPSMTQGWTGTFEQLDAYLALLD